MLQSDRRNLSMMMDFYEMTMGYGYFRSQKPCNRVIFDFFYRQNPDNGGYAIFAGLEQIIDYLVNLHFEDEDIDYFRSLGCFDEEFLKWLRNFHFRGDVDAFPEGSIIYPNEPVLTVAAPAIDAQFVETAILAQANHQSLIATKTNRIVRAAQGRLVSDFGARRAHNMDAAIYGARAAYIGGAVGTATVLAGKEFGIPISGTMAHSWVMYFDSEFEAFKHYAETYPDNTILLVDTYNVLKSGVPNAIRTAREVLEPMGRRLRGIRIDSGDLTYLSIKARKMLDEAGLTDCSIVASNSLDEFTIESILKEGAKIDSFGVGERLITAKSDPVFEGVYKMSAVEENGVFVPRIKVSASAAKITNPGWKKVWRVYRPDGKAVADLITAHDETPDFSEEYCCVDSRRPWKTPVFKYCQAKEMQVPVLRQGRRVSPKPSLSEIQAFVKRQLDHEIWTEEQRFTNPHEHYLDMSLDYYAMKMKLLKEVNPNRN